MNAPTLADRPETWPYRRTGTTPGILMDFVVDEVTAPDGGVMTRNYLEHLDSVGIIAMDAHHRIAIEHQYRHPVRRVLVEAPAGLRDEPGEAALATAQRELAEEAGLQAARWQVLVDIYATPGASSQATRIFLARDLSPVPRPEGFVLAGEEAAMTLGWAGLDDLVEAIYAGTVMNPTLVAGVMALYAAVLAGRLDDLRPA